MNESTEAFEPSNIASTDGDKTTSAPTPSAEMPGVWASIKEAIRGSRLDYTAGPIGRAILILSVPLVLEMVMESVFAVVDVFYVGKLSKEAIAIVSLTEAMLTLVYALAMGLGIGASAMVARRIGEHNPDGAARAAIQSIILGLGFAAIFSIFGITMAPRLLRLMGAEDAVLKQGIMFTRVMLGGNAVIVMLFVINAIFRGAGDAAISMRVLWLANWINILLGACLIFGLGPFPKLGVTGAAIATTIGRGTGALYALWRLVRKGGRIDIHRRHLRIEPQIIARIIKLSSSAAFQVFVGMASWIVLIRIISSFGTSALAGYQIGIRVVLFALLPSWGMSNAAATMVGQNLGAKKPDRAERAVWMAGFYNMCFLGVIGLIFVLCASPIVRIFSTEADVVSYGVACLRIVACGFLFYAYGMVLTQSFNGAGDTWTPTVINLFVFWLFELPLAYLLGKTFGMGPYGVFLAMTLAFSMLAVVSGLLFRKGKWKGKVV